MEATAYMFAGPLREPFTIVIAACEEAAMAEFNRLTGRVTKPKQIRTVYVADPSVEEVLRISSSSLSPEGEYKVSDPIRFPLLTYFGSKSIIPEWILDTRTDSVRMAGEFESFPKGMLDLSSKPTAEKLTGCGGRIRGTEFDILATTLQERFPELNLEDGEDLRCRLIDECQRFDEVLA